VFGGCVSVVALVVCLVGLVGLLGLVGWGWVGVGGLDRLGWVFYTLAQKTAPKTNQKQFSW